MTKSRKRHWLLHKAAEVAVKAVILPTMKRWPWKTRIPVINMESIRVYRPLGCHIMWAKWVDSHASWADGSYMLIFGKPPIARAIHWGNILFAEKDGVNLGCMTHNDFVGGTDSQGWAK